MEPSSFLLSLFLGATWAASGQECTPKSAQSGVLNVFRTQGRSCSLLISGKEEGPRSRSYVFSDKGTLLVFNVFGDTGQNSKDTGARTYFLFPRKTVPDFQLEADGAVTILTPAGQSLTFSPETGEITKSQGMAFTEDPRITADNRGGVEFKPLSHFILDTGWEVGKVAYSHADGISTFLFPAVDPCPVPNKELFDYSKTPWDPTFRFGNDTELNAFVESRCK